MEDLETKRLQLQSLSSKKYGIYNINLLENGQIIGMISIGENDEISYFIFDEYKSTDGKINRYAKEAVRAITSDLLKNNRKPIIKAIEDPKEKIKDKSARIARSCGYTNIEGTTNYELKVDTLEEYEEVLKKIDTADIKLPKYMDRYKVEVENLSVKENKEEKLKIDLEKEERGK